MNLWLGLTTALVGFLTVLAVVAGLDPTAVAQVAGAGGLFLGAVITLVAGQPPTLNPGDTFHVTTPVGQPNFVTTVATPPHADAPPIANP